jgi:hypothetical protein
MVDPGKPPHPRFGPIRPNPDELGAGYLAHVFVGMWAVAGMPTKDVGMAPGVLRRSEGVSLRSVPDKRDARPWQTPVDG